MNKLSTEIIENKSIDELVELYKIEQKNIENLEIKTLTDCTSLTILPELKWKCDNTTNKCVQSSDGTYDSEILCNNNCKTTKTYLKCSGSPDYKCISVSGDNNNQDGCTSLGQSCGGASSHLECNKITKKCISVPEGGTNKNNCTKTGDICTPCFKEIPLIGCMSESTYKTIKWSVIGFGVLISGTLLYRIYKNIKG